jgi:uncharacterized protein
MPTSNFATKIAPRILLVLLIIVIAPLSFSAEKMEAKPAFKVLVFSKTSGYHHKAIANAVTAIEKLGKENNFSTDATIDGALFTEKNLKQYKMVVFNNTTGDVLNPTQEKAFEKYIRGGGGFVGIHAACDTEYKWKFYGDLVGCYFKSHPKQQTSTVRVIGKRHPSTKHMPAKFVHFDEWYNFRSNPQKVRVLLKLDETTYDGGTHKNNHPIAWCHQKYGGRMFYTGLGHTKACYTDPLFVKHLLGGIRWVAKLEK